MTKAQISLYWRLWSATRKALLARGLTPKEADAQRHELHIKALGEDRGHQFFRNADFDKVIGVFRAEAEPANLGAQLRQIEQPRTRNLGTIDQLCHVLDVTREYCLGILQQMNREGALDAREILLEEITDEQFSRLHIALKKVCRRRWPTKDHLVSVVCSFARDYDLDGTLAQQAVCEALHRDSVIPQLLTYEQLLVAFATLKNLAGKAVLEPF